MSYTLFRDEIPSGAFVCHHCDNPKCINPYHLFVGDQSANMADMKQKGRQRSLVGEQSNMAKITATDVAALRERYRAGESPKAIGSDYGLTYNAVWQIATGKVWKHLPGKCESRGWRYRKSKMTPEQIAEAAGLNAAGESFEKLAKRYGVVSGTVHRLVSSLRKGA